MIRNLKTPVEQTIKAIDKKIKKIEHNNIRRLNTDRTFDERNIYYKTCIIHILFVNITLLLFLISCPDSLFTSALYSANLGESLAATFSNLIEYLPAGKTVLNRSM